MGCNTWTVIFLSVSYESTYSLFIFHFILSLTGDFFHLQSIRSSKGIYNDIFIVKLITFVLDGDTKHISKDGSLKTIMFSY